MDKSIASGLRKIMKSNVIFSNTAGYSGDASYLEPQTPFAVAFPSTTSEVSALLRFCNKKRIKVTARGGGSSLTGSSIPSKGGLVISMERMDRILEVNTEDQYAVVQPAVIIDSLNQKLSKYGYFYPPDPGSSSMATVGGTISTNAGGLRGVMYGSTSRWVLGTEVVLADGSVIDTGSRTLKLSRGYDISSLIVGSEGTLGIVTKATLRIEPAYEKIGSILAYYSDMGKACGMLNSLKKAGLPIVTAEFMDRSAIGYIRDIGGMALPKTGNYLVMIGIAGSASSVQHDMECAGPLVRGSSPVLYRSSINPHEISSELGTRKKLHALMVDEAQDSGLYVIIGDIVVPLSELAAAVHDVERLVRTSRLKVVTFGHMGEGNIHLNVFVDMKDKSAAKEAGSLMDRFGNIAIRHNGSVSAEHGIGLEKKGLLVKELASLHSSEELKLMKKIKKAFDPEGILNPGKIFD